MRITACLQVLSDVVALMAVISLPPRAAIHQAVAAFYAAGALHPNCDTLFLTFADIPTMDVLAFLGASLQKTRKGNGSSMGRCAFRA